jgi:hypothetical protein
MREFRLCKNVSGRELKADQLVRGPEVCSILIIQEPQTLSFKPCEVWQGNAERRESEDEKAPGKTQDQARVEADADEPRYHSGNSGKMIGAKTADELRLLSRGEE